RALHRRPGALPGGDGPRRQARRPRHRLGRRLAAEGGGGTGPRGGLGGAQPRLSAEKYAASVETLGLRVERVHLHERSAWEAYWRPMLRVAQEAKTSQPADILFADEGESGVELERRAVG